MSSLKVVPVQELLVENIRGDKLEV